MGVRTFLNLILLLAVAAVGAWGWVRAGESRRQIQGLEFARDRAGFLEAENKRLSAVIARRDAADALTAERAGRQEIEQAVSRLSGQKFLRPVTFKEIPHAELPAILDQKLARQVPDEEFGKVGLELSALGLIPAGMDLKKTYLGLLGEQVGAFYDQHTHELFTFSDHPLSNAQNRVVMAHELTHAMQDQHYDLLKLPLEVKGNDDLALASSALVEGDATVLMNNYLVGNLSAAALRDSLSGAFTTDVRQLAAAPRYLRESLLFPYLQGQRFIEAITAENGAGAVAAAFRNPPYSTSEIMHPEKYLALPRERPVEIDFTESVVLGQAPAMSNVLGEFTVSQVLELWSKDKPRSERVAAGWRGDRILVYGKPTAYSYLWQSVWQDEGVAREYFRLAQAGMSKRHGVAPVADEDLTGDLTLTAGGRSLRLSRIGNRTSLIDAQDNSWKDALAGLAAAKDQPLP